MNNTRTQLYESQNLQNRVAAAMQTMLEFKQKQFIGGDSLRFYKKDSGLVYDWGGVPPASPQASSVSTKVLRIKATALTQNVLFADLISEMRVDSPTAIRYTILNYIDAIYADQNYFTNYFYPDAQESGYSNIQSWTVVVGGGSQSSSRPLNLIYFKGYVVANDDVQITVTELN